MRIGLRTVIALAVVIGCVGPAAAGDPVERGLVVGGLTRVYLEVVPESLRRPAPLVLLLHGGGQSMRKLFRQRRGGTRRWLHLAERDGFVLVAPNGAAAGGGDPAGDRQSWNDLRPDKTEGNSTADDVAFIAALIDRVARDHPIDRRRVYVTGSSNGGMMTYRLLIERPELFAAAAAFIATLPQSEVPDAPRPTPLMIMNGTADKLVPYGGGAIAKTRGMARSSDATLDYWLRVNRADRSRREVEPLPDRDPGDGCRLVESRWQAGPNGAETLFVQMDGGGHAMPVATGPRHGWLVERILGPQCRDLDGADLAWAFMRRFER